jgi:signal transduction histidine kinase
MQTVDTVLDWVQLVVWVLLAAAAFNRWRLRRNASASWLALTFASLAIVVVAGMAIGDDPEQTPNLWVTKVLIAVIMLFPYLLYRFLDTMVERRRWVWITAHLLTGAVLAATVAITRFPEPNEQWTPTVTAFIAGFLVQWVFLLGYVAFRLWRAGRHQPAVTRKRMRTMGTGAFILAAILVVSAFGPQSQDPTPTSIVVALVGLLAGPFFLFGFSPPGILRTYWRRKEELAMRQMEIGLVRAISRQEIADALLPAVVNLLGGRGAALIDPDGVVLGQRGLEQHEVDALREQVSLGTEYYEALEIDDCRIIPMETGWLVVFTGPFTPFFGTDEMQMLSAASVMADLALGRAKLFELETQAREAMRDFVAIASHDLRTPVTVIQGFAQLMSGQWDLLGDEKKKEYAAAISRQVQALDRLIRDLLTVSRLDVDEVDVVPQEVDVMEAARATVEAVALDANVTVSGDECPLAIADPDHVSRMLQNYVRNAITYGAAPIEVDVTGGLDWVTVYVRDHGVGVPADFVPHLFEKFARVDKKKSKAVQGTGLGLSIVRGLARANGGDAWYEDHNGAGTCFAFRLPRAPRGEMRETG